MLRCIFQDANVKLIRELRDEIEKLRQMLSTTNQVYFSSLSSNIFFLFRTRPDLHTLCCCLLVIRKISLRRTTIEDQNFETAGRCDPLPNTKPPSEGAIRIASSVEWVYNRPRNSLVLKSVMFVH